MKKYSLNIAIWKYFLLFSVIILGFLWLTAMFVFTYEMINSDTGHRKLKQSIKESFDITIAVSPHYDEKDLSYLKITDIKHVKEVN